MAFTSAELVNITNAALDFYFTPDNLTPRERARKRLKEARQELKRAEKELAAALAYQTEVRKMPYAERNKRWEAPKHGSSSIGALSKPSFYEPPPSS